MQGSCRSLVRLVVGAVVCLNGCRSSTTDVRGVSRAHHGEPVCVIPSRGTWQRSLHDLSLPQLAGDWRGRAVATTPPGPVGHGDPWWWRRRWGMHSRSLTPAWPCPWTQVKFMTFIWRHRVHGQQASYWFDTNDMHALLVQQQDKYHSCLHLVPAHPPALSGELTRIYALF